jgi:hypothetical protein
MKDPEDSPILAIEYTDGRPRIVITRHSLWDFTWCETDHFLAYHNSGSGGHSNTIHISAYSDPRRMPGALWVASGIRICRHSSYRKSYRKARQQPWRRTYKWTYKPLPAKRQRRALARDGIQLLRSPLAPQGNADPFAWPDAIESETVYCSICNSSLLDTDTCDHLHWCDHCISWSGPGSDEDCDCWIDNTLAISHGSVSDRDGNTVSIDTAIEALSWIIPQYATLKPGAILHGLPVHHRTTYLSDQGLTVGCQTYPWPVILHLNEQLQTQASS